MPTPTTLTTGQNASAQTSYVTASVSPDGNRGLALWLAVSRTDGTDPATPTVTGCGVTWVAHVSSPVLDTGGGTQRRQIFLFRAMGASPSTGAVTISFGATTHDGVMWLLEQWDGVDTGGTNGSAAFGQTATLAKTSRLTSHSLSLVSTPASGSATAAALMTEDNTSTVTPVSPWVERHEDNYSGPGASFQVQWDVDAAQTSQWTVSDPTGDFGIGIIVEMVGPSDVTPPADPAGLNAVATGQTTGTASWTHPDEPDVDHYRVYLDGALHDTTSSLTYNFTGLSSGTMYAVEVSAVDAAGNESGKAGPDTFTTSSPPPPADEYPPRRDLIMVAAAPGKSGVSSRWRIRPVAVADGTDRWVGRAHRPITVLGAPSGSGVEFRQQTPVTYAAGSTQSRSLPDAATAGRLLVTWWAASATTADTTFTVPGTFTATAGLPYDRGTLPPIIHGAWLVAAGGEQTVQWVSGISREQTMWVGSFSGIAASPADQDGQAATSSEATSLTVTADGATAQAAELVVAAIVVRGSGHLPMQVDSGFTLLASGEQPSPTASRSTFAVAYKVLSSVDTPSVTFTWVGLGHAAAALGTWKAA